MNSPRKPPRSPVHASNVPGRWPASPHRWLARTWRTAPGLPARCAVAQLRNHCPWRQWLRDSPSHRPSSVLDCRGERVQATRAVPLLRSCPTAQEGAVSLSNDALRGGHGPGAAGGGCCEGATWLLPIGNIAKGWPCKELRHFAP